MSTTMPFMVVLHMAGDVRLCAFLGHSYSGANFVGHHCQPLIIAISAPRWLHAIKLSSCTTAASAGLELELSRIPYQYTAIIILWPGQQH